LVSEYFCPLAKVAQSAIHRREVLAGRIGKNYGGRIRVLHRLNDSKNVPMTAR